MLVIALVSGGKDSTYNMMQCAAHGHEVVALANLHPPAGGPAELDSYMYQSVGAEAIGAFAQCAGLPLYRREIRGTPRATALDYAPTEHDEVEDLHALLSDVLTRHPDARGVSSGAIMSTYQKLRVEQVCGRLGLESLAYLWQRPQLPLLDAMIADGLEAVIIKVAVAGLAASDLGRSLAQMRPRLAELHASALQTSPVGEGGEFETLTLDCPLFSRTGLRLAVRSAPVVVHRQCGDVVVAYLHPLVVEAVPRQ